MARRDERSGERGLRAAGQRPRERRYRLLQQPDQRARPDNARSAQARDCHKAMFSSRAASGQVVTGNIGKQTGPWLGSFGGCGVLGL
jgi:hypothetical protein